MNYLGIDYGESHLGLALASGPLAEPLVTTSTSINLKTVIQKYNINAIVVGNCPAHFLASLNSLNLPVFQADETLSTVDANLSLRHKSKYKRALKEHSAAAAIILQSWLDSRSNSS